MVGYVKGSKPWYNFLRARLIVISSKLDSNDISQEERERLYNEECRIVTELEGVVL